MKYEVSKSFIRATKKLSESNSKAVKEMFGAVRNAAQIEDIPNCKKLIGYSSIYRIRLGDLRAFFVFYIVLKEGVLRFEYLIPRGEAYNKKMKERLRKKDSK